MTEKQVSKAIQIILPEEQGEKKGKTMYLQGPVWDSIKHFNI